MTALAPNFEIVSQADGSAIVAGVPIFGVCSKEGFAFDEAWIDDAVAYHRAAEANKGASPVHIGHHGEPVEVKPAGAWTNTRKAPLRCKDGVVRPGVVVDLVFTNREAAERAKRGELLWRSPEIPKDAATRKSAPRFRSLALLDRHAPHNDDLPILTVSGNASVADARQWSLSDASPVLAFAARDESFVALMDPNAMPETVPATPAKAPARKRFRLSGVDGSVAEVDVPFAEDVTTTPVSLLDAVKGLTAEDLAEFHKSYVAFRAAIEATGTGIATGGPANLLRDTKETVAMSETTPPAVAAPPAPQTPPPSTGSDDVLALKADVAALKVKESQRDAADAFKRAVDESFAKIGTKRGVTREDVVRFAEGEPDPVRAAAKYADAIVAKVPEGTESFGRTMERAVAALPAEVLKFQNDGPAFENATREHARWLKQPESFRARMTLARWLEIHPPANSAFVGADDVEKE